MTKMRRAPRGNVTPLLSGHAAPPQADLEARLFVSARCRMSGSQGAIQDINAMKLDGFTSDQPTLPTSLAPDSEVRP